MPQDFIERPNDPVDWGPIGEITYLRTYARPGTGRRERWHETVARAVRFSSTLGPMEKGEAQELYDLFHGLRALPAGRTLWIGDTDISYQDGVSNYNCSFVTLRSPRDFRDVTLLLMSGAGVGGRILREDAAAFEREVPIADRQPPELEVLGRGWVGFDSPAYAEATELRYDGPVAYIRVGDSREGWAEAIEGFLRALSRAERIVVDVSSVRPLGTPLKRFGGYASGPEPLLDFFKMVRVAAFARNRPRGWTDIKLLDVFNLVGRTIVAGGTRRSAEIALGESREFAGAKIGKWASESDMTKWEKGMTVPDGTVPPWRAQSNNSLIFDGHPGRDAVGKVVGTSLERGEPGFVNVGAARRRRHDFEGVNPCLVGDTLVPVAGMGLRRIGELAGKRVPVFDASGEYVEALAEKTGKNQPILLVKLSDGSEYRVTPWHEFVLISGEKKQAQHLSEGDVLMPPQSTEGAFGAVHRPSDAYVDAWLIADGTWHNNKKGSKIYLYPPKHKYREALEMASGRSFTKEPDSQGRYTLYFSGKPALSKAHVPDYVLQGDRETALEFIRGYLESDGHVKHNPQKGWLVQVVSIHHSFLQEFQALLAQFGVFSDIKELWGGGKRALPDGKGGQKEYDTQASYRLTVTNPVRILAELGWYAPKRGFYKKQKRVSVVAVEDTGEREDVYCFGVPSTNSFDLPTVHSGNCAEILLRNRGVCNLASVNVGRFVNEHGILDEVGLRRAFRLATRHSLRITNVDFGPMLAAWDQVQKEDRLLGVSMGGIVDAANKMGVPISHVLWLARSWREVVHQEARRYASEMGVPIPLLATTIKPEGTQSTLTNSSAGIHDPYAPYFIRRVRVSEQDPIAEALKRQGFRWEKDLMNRNTLVFDFPVSTTAHRTANEVPAIEMLERYKDSMRFYVDHNTSITVAVGQDEVEDVVDWLDTNWDEVVAVSLLPKADAVYPQQPYEQISEEEYRRLKAETPTFDRGILDQIEGFVGVSLTDDLDADCATGVCPVR